MMGATDRVSLRLSRRFDAKAKKPLRYRCNPTGQQGKFKRTRGLVVGFRLVAFSLNYADPMLSMMGKQIRRPVVEIYDHVMRH